MNEYSVDIIMVTYNQEKYISQAIESVLNQKTNFPFRLIIGEDCSTDNTGQICEGFAADSPDRITLVRHEKNQGLVRNYKSILKLSKAKYISILEGDDFWIDELKLQKQVDILKSDDSIGLVHANYFYLINGEQKYSNISKSIINEEKVFEDLFTRNYICPLTVLFKKSLLDEHVDFDEMINNNYSTIDYLIWLELSNNSKVVFMDEVVGCYRKEIGSISNPSNFENLEKFYDTVIRIREKIALKYKLDRSLIQSAQHNFFYGLMLKSIHFKAYDKTKEYVSRCKPISFKEKIKCLLAKSNITIKLGKFFKIYN